MAKIWIQGKERFMCPVCKNEEIELRQKYCQICGEPLEWEEDKQDHFVEANKTIGQDINDPTKWIPVEERLPEKDGVYLVTMVGELVGDGNLFVGMEVFEDDTWYADEGDFHPVIAWMPLPEPYQKEKDDAAQSTVADWKEKVTATFLKDSKN